MFINQRLIVRSKKVSVPEPLEPTDLICWKHRATPKSPVINYEGMPWGYEEIFDIFEILSQVVDAEDFSDGTKWFTFDKDELKRVKLQAVNTRESSAVRYPSKYTAGNWLMTSSNVPDTTTWFSTLSAVASRVVISLIHIKLEYMDEKGKKTSISKQTCKDIMTRIPTSWALSEQPIAHLPIGSSPLHEWVSFFKSEEDSDLLIPLSDPITREFKEINSEKFVEIPQQAIDLELKNASAFKEELNS